MAREKGSAKKIKKILIRVSKSEKALAEAESKTAGMNTSEFFRDLLKKHVEEKALSAHKEDLEEITRALEAAGYRLNAAADKLLKQKAG